MDKETREMFKMVIREIDKLAEKINEKFEKADAKIDYVYESLLHEINACKLDRDTVALLVKKTDELDSYVSALED